MGQNWNGSQKAFETSCSCPCKKWERGEKEVALSVPQGLFLCMETQTFFTIAYDGFDEKNWKLLK